MKVFYARRKTIKRIITWSLIICALAAVIGIYNVQGDRLRNLLFLNKSDSVLIKASQGLTQYEISVVFSPDEHKLYCKQRIDYINREDETLTELYFHLYPNAFRYKDKPAFPPEEMERAYPNGFSSGEINFDSLYINNKTADFIIGGFSDDILKITLEHPLQSGQRAEINMEYIIVLPNSPGRFGYGDNTFNVANWYPILCVYDEKGWNLDPYYSIGDPFYSDAANYEVNITAPREYVIATTGDVMEVIDKDGEKVWNIQANAVRDFAWIGSNKFSVSQNRVGKTTVYSYYFTPDGGSEALDYGTAALEIFNRLFGEYPYKQLSIVQTDFFIGGMEYPNLIMVDGTLYGEEDRNWLEIITVHEVAHQWWYGMVGNDEIDEAWLDESLTEYSTVLYYGQRYGEKKEQLKYEELISKGKYQLFRVYTMGQNIDETIDRPIHEFDDWVVYDSLVYGKGAMMFHELREKMGDEVFFRMLQEYFTSHRFENATGKDLMAACYKVSGKEWDAFFEKWLYDK